MTEATDLTGLFIDKGPVVQVKDSFGKVEVESDVAAGAAYSGPLAVLVDNGEGDAHNPVLLDVPHDGGGSTLLLFFGKRPASPGGEFDLPAPLLVRCARDQLRQRRRHAARREAIHPARGVPAESQQAREAEHRAHTEVAQHVERHAQRVRPVGPEPGHGAQRARQARTC